jgi:hypothetical protein
MKIFRTLPLLAALFGATNPALVLAQASTAPSTAASAASSPAPVGPRVMTPTEQRRNVDEASAPDLRPDRPVVPQISVPLGRKPPVPAGAASRAPRSGAAPTPGHIGDAAARCESAPDDLERAACRKRLAQTKPPT